MKLKTGEKVTVKIPRDSALGHNILTGNGSLERKAEVLDPMDGMGVEGSNPLLRFTPWIGTHQVPIEWIKEN